MLRSETSRLEAAPPEVVFKIAETRTSAIHIRLPTGHGEQQWVASTALRTLHRHADHTVVQLHPQVAMLPVAVIARAAIPSPNTVQSEASVLPTPMASPSDMINRPQDKLIRHGRIALSTWGFFRPDGASNALASGGQLGGSQLGFRLALPVAHVSDATGVSLSMRGYSPLGSRKGKEAALGVSVQKHGTLSLGLIAERRIGIDGGGRDAFAAMVIAGVSSVPVARGFDVSAYGQAGIVGARRRDAFVDGAVTLDHPVGASRARVGVGAWGAAQPGVRRLDTGPQVSVPLPLVGQSARISAQWRFRIAGNANPGSGPAIIVGADF
jgi:hypothetical protein